MGSNNHHLSPSHQPKEQHSNPHRYVPCQHLLEFRHRLGAAGTLRALQHCVRTEPSGRASIRRAHREVPQCGSCARARGRLYACLSCGAIGCWESIHARLHAESNPGHGIAVDIERAELFCCLCGDQVYDCEFDRAVIGARAARREAGENGAISSYGDVESRKRRRGVEFKPWAPSAREQLALKQDSIPLIKEKLPAGLRGFNNLGNTCFMNSVLQALLHTPPLRNYFLSDHHNRAVCQRRASHLCLGCDMDTIFAAAFSGERTPYSPAQFLYSWWRHAANLAGYEQQDAHEFFISTVNGIHANSSTTSPRAKSQDGRAGDVDCRCIVHRVFSGLLRSDVTCTVCGFSSTTYDPCVDISLDLEPDFGTEKAFTESIYHEYGGRTSRAASSALGASTLLGCLDRFTRPERLGANEKFFCQQCQTRQESIKQMSMRKVPLVLCFHIKRFEHSSSRNTSRKVDRYVQFPFFLDVLPYLSSSVVRLRHGNRLLSVSGDACDSLPPSQSPSEFELFAVVTHSGKLDSGHYVSFLRLNKCWYKCDDAWITRVSEDYVRTSQAYMLYYVQKTLFYKASDSVRPPMGG